MSFCIKNGCTSPSEVSYSSQPGVSYNLCFLHAREAIENAKGFLGISPKERERMIRPLQEALEKLQEGK